MWKHGDEELKKCEECKFQNAKKAVCSGMRRMKNILLRGKGDDS